MKTRSKRGTFKRGIRKSERGTPTSRGAKSQSNIHLPPSTPRRDEAKQRRLHPPTPVPAKQSRPKANPRSPNSSSPVPHSELRAPRSPNSSSPVPRSELRAPRSPKSPKLDLESAIATRRKSQTELTHLAKLLGEKSVRQTALETAGNLHNPAVLAEIGRLQIFTALLPRRIAAQEENDLKSEQSLIEGTNQFIRDHLSPRVKRLAARTRAIVEAELSPHFRDAAALAVAVARSERVRRLQELDCPVSLAPARGALEHAQTALKSCAEADKLEKTLAAASPL
jgi:hypothetical protein